MWVCGREWRGREGREIEREEGVVDRDRQEDSTIGRETRRGWTDEERKKERKNIHGEKRLIDTRIEKEGQKESLKDGKENDGETEQTDRKEAREKEKQGCRENCED